MNKGNIMKVYRTASPMDIQDGLSWYRTAHKEAVKIANETGHPLHVAAGVIAALSPNNKWGRNVQDARNLLTYGTKAKFCTYGANVAKAVQIVNASPDQVPTILNGRKTVSFYDNILNLTSSDRVTIDGHAYNIARGARSALVAVPSISKGLYTDLENMYKETACKVGVHPIEMQAIVWVAWRRRSTGQLSIF